MYSTIEKRKAYDIKRNKTSERKAYMKNMQKQPRHIAYHLKYREDNRLEIKRKNHIIYIKNRDKILARTTQYQKDHPEVMLKHVMKKMNESGNVLGMNRRTYGSGLIAWSRIIHNNVHGCVICGGVEKLEAHHLFFKNPYPKLSLNPNNGILLCHQHHMELHHGTNPKEI